MKYEERLVAFIDILGFKEIVRQSESDSIQIEFIYSILKYLKKWDRQDKWDLRFVEIEERFQYGNREKYDIREKTNSTSFSDSIVVSVKVDDDINEVTSTLVANLAYMGALLLKKGILFRGGLTFGDVIHDDNGTVFGQGLTDAYMLESKNAIYPRIIMSDKLIKKLNYPINTKHDSYPYHQYINNFGDGYYGFHQMIYFEVIQSWSEKTVEDLTNSLNVVREVIVKGLGENIEKPKVYKKYEWLKDEYNKLTILGESVKENILEVCESIPG